jgi:hypothetical protein
MDLYRKIIKKQLLNGGELFEVNWSRFAPSIEDNLDWETTLHEMVNSSYVKKNKKKLYPFLVVAEIILGKENLLGFRTKPEKENMYIFLTENIDVGKINFMISQNSVIKLIESDVIKWPSKNTITKARLRNINFYVPEKRRTLEKGYRKIQKRRSISDEDKRKLNSFFRYSGVEEDVWFD